MGDTIREIEAAEMETKPYNAADPEQVNDARKRSGRRKSKSLEFVEAMMKLKEGREWLWDMMGQCNIFGNPLVKGDTHETYFQLGQQDIGKRILSQVQAFPELYVQACKETGEKNSIEK